MVNISNEDITASEMNSLASKADCLISIGCFINDDDLLAKITGKVFINSMFAPKLDVVLRDSEENVLKGCRLKSVTAVQVVSGYAYTHQIKRVAKFGGEI